MKIFQSTGLSLFFAICVSPWFACAQEPAKRSSQETPDWVTSMPVSMNGKLRNGKLSDYPTWRKGTEKTKWHDLYPGSWCTDHLVFWKAEDFFDDLQVVQLCKAISKADVDEMKRLIEAGVDINTVGVGGMTPLFWAFFLETDPRPFGLLLKHGADPNQTVVGPKVPYSAYGTAVTHLVCMSSYNRHFKNVFEAGGDPNLPAKKNLIYAGPMPPYCQLRPWAPDSAERMQLLIDKGARLDVVLNTTPFIAARCTHQEEFCKMILVAIKGGGDYKRVHRETYFDEYEDCYFRPIHRLALAEPKANERPRSEQTHFRALVKWLDDHGESFDEAKADLKQWRIWIIQRRRDLIEKQHQERLKLKKKQPVIPKTNQKK